MKRNYFPVCSLVPWVSIIVQNTLCFLSTFCFSQIILEMPNRETCKLASCLPLTTSFRPLSYTSSEFEMQPLRNSGVTEYNNPDILSQTTIGRLSFYYKTSSHQIAIFQGNLLAFPKVLCGFFSLFFLYHTCYKRKHTHLCHICNANQRDNTELNSFSQLRTLKLAVRNVQWEDAKSFFMTK